MLQDWCSIIHRVPPCIAKRFNDKRIGSMPIIVRHMHDESLEFGIGPRRVMTDES